MNMSELLQPEAGQSHVRLTEERRTKRDLRVLRWWRIFLSSLSGTRQDASGRVRTHQDASGRVSVHTTKDAWSNASQTTSASGLSDRITVRLDGRFILVFRAVHLWSDRMLKPGVNRVPVLDLSGWGWRFLLSRICCSQASVEYLGLWNQDLVFTCTGTGITRFVPQPSVN